MIIEFRYRKKTAGTGELLTAVFLLFLHRFIRQQMQFISLFTVQHEIDRIQQTDFIMTSLHNCMAYSAKLMLLITTLFLLLTTVLAGVFANK